MSGISGILHVDGRPVDRAELVRMTDAIAHRGPDGTGHWVAGPVGLGHRMLHTTPEAREESQPLADDSGQVCLTLDGRVDNRRELRARLDGAGRRLRDDTDAELVLQAYGAWGRACARRLIGDFALAIWDGRSRELFCARDFLGKRPFYYSYDGPTFRWGSEPQAVLADPSISREPNEGMIGELLAGAVTSTTETLFRHLHRLAPAHWLVVSEAGVRASRYWTWEPDAEVRHRTDDDYGHHFLEVFTEAVRDRLRTVGPPACELSGGLDSSTVAVVAQSLRAPADGPLDTYSAVFPGLACDESGYIDDVVAHGGLTSHRFCPAPLGAETYEEQIRRHLDLPVYPNIAMTFDLSRMARTNGSRALLTGEGGDDWLTGSASSCADLLRHLRPVGLGRQLSAMARAPGGASRRHLFWRYGVAPLVPPSVRSARRRALALAGRDGHDGPSPWLTPAFRRRIDLADRIRPPARPRGVDLALWEQVEPLTSGWTAHIIELVDRSSAWSGVERRDPFHDRRHVELALALPADQRLRAGDTKFVLRTAMRGLLPERVRLRSTKAEFSHPFAEELITQGGARLFADLRLERLGWVDGDAVRHRFADMQDWYERGDQSYSAPAGELWSVLSLERWLRVVDAR